VPTPPSTPKKKKASQISCHVISQQSSTLPVIGSWRAQWLMGATVSSGTNGEAPSIESMQGSCLPMRLDKMKSTSK